MHRSRKRFVWATKCDSKREIIDRQSSRFQKRCSPQMGDQRLGRAQAGGGAMNIIKFTKPKSCGSCAFCCKLLAVRALDKPQFEWCKHCSGSRCGIYNRRPKECRDFTCVWLINADLGPEWQPNICNFMLTLEQRSPLRVAVRCDPDFPDAWRRSPYRDQIQRWANIYQCVFVYVGYEVTAITPRGEYPIGTHIGKGSIQINGEGMPILVPSEKGKPPRR
jgi:hypothetical protein